MRRWRDAVNYLWVVAERQPVADRREKSELGCKRSSNDESGSLHSVCVKYKAELHIISGDFIIRHLIEGWLNRRDQTSMAETPI